MRFLIYTLTILTLTSCSSLRPSKGLDKELSLYPYPHEVYNFHFKSQDQKLKMSYMDIGEKTKPAFVLMHGKNFTGAYFEGMAEFLNKKGYRVIIIDQLGFGKSSKPINYQYTFQQLAANTNALLKSLNISSYHLLGHSMGGMLATRYALMYPKEVKKLFLLNPIGLEDWKTVTPYQTVDELYQAQLKTTSESIKNYQVKFYYDNKWKEEYENWVIPLIGWNEGPDREHMAKISALTSDMIVTQPVFYEFRNLKVPTILLIGDRDRTAIGANLLPPELAKKMGRYDLLGPKIQMLIPNAKLVMFKNIGHLPHIENPELFQKELLKFL